MNAHILRAGKEAGACALAAAAVGAPIGPFSGAIFGLYGYLSSGVLTRVVVDHLNANHPQASIETKTVTKALVIFGSYAIAWAALALIGIMVPFTHTVALIVISYATGLLVDIAMGCLGINTRAEPAPFI